MRLQSDLINQERYYAATTWLIMQDYLLIWSRLRVIIGNLAFADLNVRGPFARWAPAEQAKFVSPHTSQYQMHTHCTYQIMTVLLRCKQPPLATQTACQE